MRLRCFMKRSMRLVVFVLLVVGAGNRPACGAPLRQALVFEQGESGYNTIRIPALVKDANGDLLAFAEGRVNSASDTGNIDVIMKRSTDGGLTWGPLQVVQDYGNNTAGNPVPILDSGTGNLVLLTTRNLGQDTQAEIQAGTSDGTRTVWVQHSTDHGQTWTAPVEITASVKDPLWRWYATGPGGGIQLRDGENAGRLIAGANHSSVDVLGGGAQLIFSDDGGLTWQSGALMVNDAGSSYLPSESQTVELIDGSINVNSRNRGDFRASSIISNAGETFVSGHRETQLVDPAVEGSIERFTRQDDGHESNSILFSNPAHPTERREMTVKASYDETATWSDGKLVHRGPSGYSDLVLVSDPAVDNPVAGLLYESGENDYRENITFATFDQSWLQSPDLMRLGFVGQSIGTNLPSGSTVLDTHGNGEDATLVGGGASIVEGSGVYGFGDSRALRFDGMDDRLRVADTSDHLFDFEGDESFTLEAVFATSNHASGGASGSGPLVAKDVGPGQPAYWLRVEDGGLRFFVDDGAQTADVVSPATVTDGRWHHVAAVFDAGVNEMRLYLDDELVDTCTTLAWGSLANGNDLLVGGFNDGQKYFDGDLESVRISAGALDPQEFLRPVWTGVLGDVNQDAVLAGDGTGPAASDDLSAFIAGWAATGLPGLDDPLASYMAGDLDFDGATDLDDAFLMRTYLLQQGMSASTLADLLATEVPEPSSGALMLLLATLSVVAGCRPIEKRRMGPGTPGATVRDTAPAGGMPASLMIVARPNGSGSERAN